MRPFFFFNGNTFASIGRTLADRLFADLPVVRRRSVVSLVGHYISGVLDRPAMIQGIDELSQPAAFHPGDRVQTLKGSLQGTVTAIREDGLVLWKPDGATSEIVGNSASLKNCP